ncbi:hypothetical protein GEV33_010316 [Tenebrio molitor]|uniref:Protein Wnt n=1 Tax=Tenebrio molitor TaxID=7067 RepID=A0A8J6HD52_TENMO|nr:hypothetical protein GEV33_010316 [Tenebrio molitor]
MVILCVLQIDCGVVLKNVQNCGQKNTVDTNVEGRKEKEDLMSKILPMMVMPFMVQTTLLPIMLMSMKFMLLKSMFLGKLAIIFGFVTLLKNLLKNGGGLYSHNVNLQSASHHNSLNQNYHDKQHFEIREPYGHKRTRKKRGLLNVLQMQMLEEKYFNNKALDAFQGLNPVLMDSVMNGAQTAMNECKNVFKWSRWNCPQSAFSKQYKHLPTKEKAYTDAIIAAGIIYSITQDCSQGVIKGCGCDPNRQEPQDDSKVLNQIEKDWTWGGCSHDASYGEDLVLKMLESNEKDSDAQAFVSRHNNRVGREIIREKMLKKCKCHGVSGSCSFQTCWMQMPSFTEIAKELRDRYHNSILISFEKVREGLTLGNSARHLPLVEDHLPNNLVYLERSDSFCFSNNTTGKKVLPAPKEESAPGRQLVMRPLRRGKVAGICADRAGIK